MPCVALVHPPFVSQFISDNHVALDEYTCHKAQALGVPATIYSSGSNWSIPYLCVGTRTASVTHEVLIRYPSGARQVLIIYSSGTHQILISYSSVTHQLLVSYSSVTHQTGCLMFFTRYLLTLAAISAVSVLCPCDVLITSWLRLHRLCACSARRNRRASRRLPCTREIGSAALSVWRCDLPLKILKSSPQ